MRVQTSLSRSCALDELPRRLLAKPEKAFEGPAPPSGVHASFPVTISLKDMVISFFDLLSMRLQNLALQLGLTIFVFATILLLRLPVTLR
jgi:hypothetical protein